ncbi:MAG: tRNA (adenosine(37)-N6)-threonylcarbamoyltransferase complex dimerization subunit type 1 TsaB [Acetivibrio sp.]
MKLLGIDSSGIVASTALFSDGVMLAEYTTNFKKTHSQTLLPMIEQIVKMTETELKTIDAIAVAGGPGSFTGLRIGSATAKGLALALNKPIISVPTLEGLAYNFFGCEAFICPIMDARRSQVYTGLYRFEGEKFEIISEQKAISIEELMEDLEERKQKVIFLGDGVGVYRDFIEKNMKTEFLFAPKHLLMQRAGAVCTRAEELYKQGKIETAVEHKPDYLRLSQAERERAEKQPIKNT